MKPNSCVVTLATFMSFAQAVTAEDPFGPRNPPNQIEDKVGDEKMVKEKINLFVKTLRTVNDVKLERRYGSFESSPGKSLDLIAVKREIVLSFLESLSRAGEVADESEAEVICEIVMNENSEFRIFLIMPFLNEGKLLRGNAVIRILSKDKSELDVKLGKIEDEIYYVELLSIIGPKYRLNHLKPLVESRGFKWIKPQENGR